MITRLHRAHRLPNFDSRTTLSPTHVALALALALDQLEAMVGEFLAGINISA